MLNVFSYNSIENHSLVRAVLSLFVIFSATVCAAQESQQNNAADLEFFRQKIQPVLEAQCYDCHSDRATEIKGNLYLDSRQGLLEGGNTRPAIVPGDAEKSLLIHALRHDDLEMPPDKERLPDAVIADFEKWIERGAADPRERPKTAAPRWDWAQAREHWSFQPIKSAPPPAAKDHDWPHNWIDQFVLAKLESEQLAPAPAATNHQLVRRVYFDLTGLPPTPEEVNEFVNDPSPLAYEALVDRLLATPQYGERWAEQWLDVVRYAETEGFEYDRTIPDAWRYRDYVIRSFSQDKPFDRFVMEQIAGDELDASNQECLTAAIFHRLGPVRRNAGNPEIALSRNEVLTERTDVIGSAFLGITIGCARCHDHKFDPILQRDYYRLQAYVAATQEYDVILANDDERSQWDAIAKPLNAQIKMLRNEAEHAPAQRKQEIHQDIEELERKLPAALPTIPTIRDDLANATAIHILRRGVWENKGDRVHPRPPSVLVADDLSELPDNLTTPRIELARWIVDPANPLTARVIANRVWQRHFGQGLVRTANDLGSHGDLPSHPELLDALADELIKNGWHVKALDRLIVLSNAYRQAAANPAQAATAMVKDPENRWLWHFNRRRLSAEEIRDAMLAAAGRLNSQCCGPSVIVPVDQPLVDLLYEPTQWSVTPNVGQHQRRSIYLMAKRNLRLPFMEVFDQPTTQTSCPRRDATTHARQALELMNGALSNELAAAFARRLQAECGTDVTSQINRAFQLTAGRPATPDELSIATSFLQTSPLEEFALATFNLNGFLYVQ